MTPAPLPIDTILPALAETLAGHPACVLEAPPGSGKTTRVPLALLDAPWLAGRSIVMLEPRRLAAGNAARFLARSLGEEVGGTVGYAMRYERCVSENTRIEVVTEGILIRRLQRDPELNGVGLVIFDEFHERNLNADLALALCRDVQLGLRDDLKLLVMSATLDAAPVAALLGGAPRIQGGGRSFPVAVHYLPQPSSGRLGEQTALAVRRALRENAGDLLVFLPGSGEIRRCAEALADLAASCDVRPLYGDLSYAEQERAILPGARRRVVLATNIAETSLTIEGVTVVVDAGFERRPRFDAARGMSTLELVRISRASAEQRAGRAGRLAPGVCYRLWSEGEHGALLPHTPPEIRSADLAPLALDLSRWGVPDVAQLAWLDPPPAGHLHGARELLQRLGALTADNRLTPLGERMAHLPVHPRLARMLVAAQEEGAAGLGADLAALLAERDLYASPAAANRSGDCDLAERLLQMRPAGSDPVARAARYWRKTLQVTQGESNGNPQQIGRLLAQAFPDRIGRERSPGSGRYLLSGGFGARLSPRSVVKGGEWLVAVEVAGQGGGEGEIRLASRLCRESVEELFGAEIRWQREVDWDERSGRVVAREVRRLGAVSLQERPVTADAADAVPALLGVLRRRRLETLGWSPESRQWCARVQLLARYREDWPDLGTEMLLATLEDWLAPFLAGMTTLEALQRFDPLPALQALLGHARQRELERLAPERFVVPSGSRVRLDYTAEDGPVLACKLQELFGLAETPRIADGAHAVQVQLLSPAGRPLAVTRDLRSFWNNVYPEVKRELKGRYPRHPWPDDPWNAVATAKTRKRLEGR